MYAAVVNKNIYLYIHIQEESLHYTWLLAADNRGSSTNVEEIPAPRRTHQTGNKDHEGKVALNDTSRNR